MESTLRATILVVSDDPDLLRSIAEAVQPMHFDVIAAVDLREAVERLQTHAPLLVCVDLSLPRGSGFDVCELVRGDAARATVQILIVSDRVTPEDMADAEEAGGNAFIAKPFPQHLLRRYVQAMLQQRPSSNPRIRELRPSMFPPPEEP